MKNGGQAYPSYADSSGGISLRDYYAGQALMGLLATTVDWSEKYSKETVNKVVAEMSYELADAMLAKREAGKKPLCPSCPELGDCPHADNRNKCWEYDEATGGGE